ncbi:MAG: transposase, partial [Mycobacteriaceae bacterium]|nr:transposase [Mycobacteriaceae bacterium]
CQISPACAAPCGEEYGGIEYGGLPVLLAGYKKAATDQLPEATTVMNPFHVVALAGTKLDLCRQRLQHQTCGHRGRSGDPLYGVRRTLRTRWPLLSNPQQARLSTVFADDDHLAAVVTWSIYQRIIAAYTPPRPAAAAEPYSPRSSTRCAAAFPLASRNWPSFGRTLWRRRHDFLAYFDHHISHTADRSTLKPEEPLYISERGSTSMRA